MVWPRVQAQVEYTVTRGKRVIQQSKIVQLPRGCNFKQGKSLLLEAYDLEENKWELVHDDRVRSSRPPRMSSVSARLGPRHGLVL